MRRRQPRSGPRRPGSLPWLGALVAAYLVLPLLVFLTRVPADGAAPWRQGGLWPAMFVSAATATVTTVLAAVSGVPLAYWLARSRTVAARLLSGAVLVPLALPPLVSGVVLVSVTGPATALGRLFDGRLTDSLAGVVLAQLFVAAPFAVVVARTAFAQIDQDVLDVAATMGLRPWRRLLAVAVPAVAPAIGAGLLLTWLRAFGEFGATVILAYHPYSLPVLTYVRFSGYGLHAAMAPAAVSIVVAALVVGAALALAGRARRAAPVDPEVPARPVPRTGDARTAPRVQLAVRCRVGDLDVAVGAVAPTGRVAVLGPSGAGKTTMLRALAGLVPGGDVELDDEPAIDGPVERRPVAY
ncbi:MAG TPA: ABC transporter permease subunit, partial [Acidimicrobiales bacterium]|nr:ABC transporter permease subunit [Acidimicrobiales bacterium]